MAGMSDMMAEEPGDAEMGEGASDEALSEEDREIDAFLDPEASPEDKRMAFKEAVRLCMEKYGPGAGGGGEAGPPKKPGGGLALIFGAPKRKG